MGFGEQAPILPRYFMSHSNHTLRFMSFPVSDISQAYRSAPERTEDVWQKVEGAILSRVRKQGAEGSPHP